jgi:putative tryptophan/tyrosine transport system substrate-binding protein
MIRRRELMALVVGAAAWPCAVIAEPVTGRGGGVLANEPWPPLEGLRQGLEQLGYVEGQNVHLEYRFAQGKTENLPALAAELVHLPVEVIVTVGSPASLAVMRATSTIPIIVQSGDPIAAGLASNLAHPGGNVTGMSSQATEVEAKRLQLLKELLPSLARRRAGEPDQSLHQIRSRQCTARGCGPGP